MIVFAIYIGIKEDLLRSVSRILLLKIIYSRRLIVEFNLYDVLSQEIFVIYF